MTFKIKDEFKGLDVHLDIPYDWQRDNKTVFGSPDRECQTSSNFMVAEYLTKGYPTQRAKLNGMGQGVNWWAYHCHSFGDTTSGHAHSEVWEKMLGIPSTVATDGDLNILLDYLSKGVPVAIGVHYKSSGHWVVVVGVDEPNKMFRVHDPFGCRNGATNVYLDTSEVAGKNDYYSFNLMRHVWSCTEWQYQNFQAGDGAGWYRKVNKEALENYGVIGV